MSGWKAHLSGAGLCRTLEENMVITVEPGSAGCIIVLLLFPLQLLTLLRNLALDNVPGCYFGAYLMQPALNNPTTAPFLVRERLEPLIVCHVDPLTLSIKLRTYLSLVMTCAHIS